MTAMTAAESSTPKHSAESLLSVENLRIFFTSEGLGETNAVDGVSFTANEGETLGIVGESGSGKSVSVMSLLRLLPMPPARITGGKALWNGEDLFTMSSKRLRAIRGREIAMIFQEPMTSLNPVFTIGEQIAEALTAHGICDYYEAWERAAQALKEVGLPSAEKLRERFPHELSGGQKQRAMIAMALIGRPRLLICDEPTTALDVTVQAQILDLLRSLQKELGMAMIFITHNLGVIAELAHRAAVMYAGRIVETASAEELFSQPMHPYTLGLFACLPRLTGEKRPIEAIPGIVPEANTMPSGCRFHPRCPKAKDRCRNEDPILEEKSAGHWSACHYQ